MSTHLLFLLLGLGSGSVIAGVGMALVLNQKGTGVLHFGIAGIGLWGAFTFDELRSDGDLVLPLVVVPHRISVGDVPTGVAIAAGVGMAAILGAFVQWAVIQRVRSQAPLAGVVASVGILLVFQTLTPLRFGTSGRRVEPILPSHSIEIAGQLVPIDRLLLAGIIVGLAALTTVVLSRSNHGLALRAAGDDETAVALAGWSPAALGGVGAASACGLATLVLVLASPAVGLNPASGALLLVPGLAAALAGRLDSIIVAAVAGLVLGGVQSELVYLSSKAWWPSWAIAGVGDAIPFLLIVILLVVLGARIPTRASLLPERLPPFLRPSASPLPALASLAVASALVLLTDGGVRFGVVTSIIVSLAAMSLVVITGMLGQPSFGQAAIAGLSGFVLSKLASEVGIGFPWAPLLAVAVATLGGVVLGLPALRIRGIQLAVVTLAAAVAVEQLVLRNPRWTTQRGNLVPRPELFGVDLGVRDATHITRWQFGAFAIVIVGLCVAGFRTLARSHMGLRFLAVRTDERAAAAIGVDVTRIKLAGFTIGSLLAAIAGVLFAYSRGQVSADSYSVLIGISWLAFAYLGGITSLSGAVIAGTMAPLGLGFVLVNRLVETGDWYLLAGGIGLTVTAVLNPHGIAGTLPRRQPVAFAPPPPRSGPTSLAVRDAQPLSIEDLSVRFGGVTAVRKVSLTVAPGRLVGLIGPNGAGKTSVIDAITGFVPSTGRVRIGLNPLDGLAPHRRTQAGLARTWQGGQLFDELTVFEHLAIARNAAKVADHAGDTDPRDLLDLVGIGNLGDRRPPELSLGQRKLVGVARALACRPDVLLLDEPAAGLDSTETAHLAGALRSLTAGGHGVLLIDHDLSLIHAVCDDLYVMDAGEVIASGAVAEVVGMKNVVEAYLGTPTLRTVSP